MQIERSLLIDLKELNVKGGGLISKRIDLVRNVVGEHCMNEIVPQSKTWEEVCEQAIHAILFSRFLNNQFPLYLIKCCVYSISHR